MKEMRVLGKSALLHCPGNLPELAGNAARKTAAFESHANPANMQSVRRAS
jgi:hypothetical protein